MTDKRLKRIIELVKTKHKRIGLRMLYSEYEVPEEKRPLWRDLWELVRGDIDATDEKGKENPHCNEEAVRG